MAINGHKGMAFSMSYSPWSLDVVKSSLDCLQQDGFNTKIVHEIRKSDSGEEGIEVIITIEWK